MKKLLFIALIVLSLVSCDKSYRLSKIRAEKSKTFSNVVNDSTMFGILLGDTRFDTFLKLKSFDRYDEIAGYEFLDQELKGINFKLDDWHMFHNDSLVKFRLEAENYGIISSFNKLIEIYSLKYGNPDYKDNLSAYWIMNNKDIVISMDNETLSISYERPWIYAVERYRDDDKSNTFSKDYWDLHYKQKSDSIKNSNTHKINSDI